MRRVCWVIDCSMRSRSSGRAAQRGNHVSTEAGQHRQRRADLVRDIGDEVAPHHLVALALGHILRQHQPLADAAVAAHQHRRQKLRRLCPPSAAARCCPTAAPRQKPAMRTRLVMRWPMSRSRDQPEMDRSHLAEPDDLLVGIEQQHAVGRGLDRAQELLADAARVHALVALQQRALGPGRPARPRVRRRAGLGPMLPRISASAARHLAGIAPAGPNRTSSAPARLPSTRRTSFSPTTPPTSASRLRAQQQRRQAASARLAMWNLPVQSSRAVRLSRRRTIPSASDSPAPCTVSIIRPASTGISDSRSRCGHRRCAPR